MFRPVFIEARDLGDCWFQLLRACKERGRKYLITSGSYEGQYRYALDFASCFIHYPHTRPLAPILSPRCPLPPPTTDEEIEKYFVNYLMDSKLSPNEHYRYSTWIVGGEYQLPPVSGKYMPNKLDQPPYKVFVPNQLEWVINHFKTKGFGNEHCFITIGYPESNFGYDVEYNNPNERMTSPCLRGLDFRMIEDNGEYYLFTCVYYRCLPEDTPLMFIVGDSTVRGTLADLAKHYATGSDVYVFGLNNNSISPVRVGQVSKTTTSRLTYITVKGGERIYATSNHRFPVYRDGNILLMRADEIICGDKLLEPKYISNEINNCSGDTVIDVAKITDFNGVECILREVIDVGVIISGVCDVYDIGIESESHLFVAGNVPILTHNSWDLASGWPTNMGGFTLLNEYIASELGVNPGPLACSCKSLHCYDHAIQYLEYV